LKIIGRPIIEGLQQSVCRSRPALDLAMLGCRGAPARDGRLRAEVTAAVRQPSAGQLKRWIEAQPVEVVAIGIAPQPIASMRARRISATVCVMCEGSRWSAIRAASVSATARRRSASASSITPLLRDADIEQQNLVAVSSILPPHCELITSAAGIATLVPGEITFCVMARAETNEQGRRIAAGIGLARPKDPAHYGYISEHHGFGMTQAEIGDYVEDLAATMLASTLGIEFDPDAAWNERRRVYELSDLIVDSLSVTAAAEGTSNGDWTCAVAAAVFRFANQP
jgi:arginine decarboxylase